MTNFSLYQQNSTFSENTNFVVILTLEPTELTFTNDAYSFTISDSILPFRNYSFTVDACNEIGCSEHSDETEVTETEQESKYNYYHYS